MAAARTGQSAVGRRRLQELGLACMHSMSMGSMQIHLHTTYDHPS